MLFKNSFSTFKIARFWRKFKENKNYPSMGFFKIHLGFPIIKADSYDVWFKTLEIL
jgi:hypothetical protein